ncbi:bifunctional 3-(3-hydroxy-phenyl)propionate/3-hydroxycinnamic acid hydroxylase [Rhizobium rhizogenes]|uniref:bifunctional 3-(3-hydroxy-phenyl)propionate/3-hydroxycinnamic acid hydroxylase n=1 Tax=Rhizobium rhizogenes TaxID=359 RepID=UPI001294BC59|nr:bifunctional 3-(3-hydroxy-phenyl)propionate/3-hydroxycinnamic acid hydroxylase [Rhizobium rhizogenes]MQB34283.1 bifunctional 3-(3-hydroxy-phenyl)propionate/3-hydroxycinnamic acid hydroxylase [Rhizobium rhizogenes]
MDLNSFSADVVIVGLGPTGMVLANFLGKMGWSVVGLERDEDIYYAPRAVHFDDEIMRIFQAIGLSEDIARTSEPFTDMELLGKPGGKPLMRAKIGHQDQRYGHHGAWWFHQPTLERHLWEGIARFPDVTTIRGAEVISIEQDDLGVKAKAKRIDGTTITVRGRYLVGCDGGRSFVRKAADLCLASANFDEAWVVVDTKARCAGKDSILPVNHQQICDPKQPVTYVPMAGPYYEWQFMVTGGKSEREATNPALVRSQLKRFVDLNRVEINRIAYYKFHALWATEWRNGRILLAGDSAHQMPPFLGQGMCSGLRDAHALAWRLDLILASRADETLLDDYQIERLDHVSHIIKGAMFLGRVIQTRHRWLAALRNTLLFWPANKSARINQLVYRTANRKQPLKRGFFGKIRPRIAGHLSIQPMVTFNGTDMLLDEAMGNGFAIVARKDTLAASRSTINRLAIERNFAFLEIGLPRSGATVVDKDGTLLTWMETFDADFVLIRPDRYVFDAGRTPDFLKAVTPLVTAITPFPAIERIPA